MVLKETLLKILSRTKTVSMVEYYADDSDHERVIQNTVNLLKDMKYYKQLTRRQLAKHNVIIKTKHGGIIKANLFKGLKHEQNKKREKSRS